MVKQQFAQMHYTFGNGEQERERKPVHNADKAK